MSTTPASHLRTNVLRAGIVLLAAASLFACSKSDGKDSSSTTKPAPATPTAISNGEQVPPLKDLSETELHLAKRGAVLNEGLAVVKHELQGLTLAEALATLPANASWECIHVPEYDLIRAARL